MEPSSVVLANDTRMGEDNLVKKESSKEHVV